MTRFRTRIFTVAFLLVLGTSPASAQVDQLASSLREAVRETMQRWSLPGVVLVVAQDGRIVLQDGFGTRVVGEERPVNDQTRIQIASHTKAVTATALAILADEGKLSWDDAVREHIPEFEVDDELASERITIRDLVSHRGGLPAPPFGGFRNPDYGIPELLEELRTRDPAPLRSQQIYSQPSIALVGEIVRRASGRSWEEFVRERILGPLGMTDSYTSNPDLLARFGSPTFEKNVMIPARKQDGRVTVGDWSDIGTESLYAPAGGITTTAADMANWIRFLLSDGVLGGTRLLSEDAMAETRTPAVLLDPALRTFTDPINLLAAGTPGWIVVNHHRDLVYLAPGGWMSCVVAIVPDKNVGVGVFTNAYFSERHGFESAFPVFALAMASLDLTLGYPLADWNEIYSAALTAAER